ncbi:hypothetical protein BQ8482_910008 [Mesorhizobium delmotii]|uniref:Uncharacterized protein n=1 Tax=Mesorhizobium delmotii TaxID=1631247 RepID=A0A2P9AXY8_9HYPH|nr:hypothetical protein BQ8482_910008 [Mesorhizobium delmotii]
MWQNRKWVRLPNFDALEFIDFGRLLPFDHLRDRDGLPCWPTIAQLFEVSYSPQLRPRILAY